jgi:hypothetical protein
MVLRVTDCIVVVFLPPAVRRLQEKNKLFFGREFRGRVCPQKLSRRRELARHFLKDGAGEIPTVFLVRYPLDLVSERVGKRDRFAYAVGRSITGLALLFHCLNRHTLSDGWLWGEVPIKPALGQGALFQQHTGYTR